MMNRIKTLIKDDHGAISTDWMALTTGLAALSLILIAGVQHETGTYLAKIHTALTATSDLH